MTPGGRDKAAARNGRLAVVAFQRWAESVSGGHRSRRDSLTHTQSETTNCQSESSKFNSCQRGTQKQSTVTSLCFITEHAHIYTLSLLCHPPHRWYYCSVWCGLSHLISPPLFLFSLHHLLIFFFFSCFWPIVSFFSFTFHLFSSFLFTCSSFYSVLSFPVLFFPLHLYQSFTSLNFLHLSLSPLLFVLCSSSSFFSFPFIFVTKLPFPTFSSYVLLFISIFPT